MTNKERFFPISVNGGATFAPSTIGAPRYTSAADTSVFAHSPAEKAIKKAVKQDWKNEMRKAYGDKWRKENNPPGELNP